MPSSATPQLDLLTWDESAEFTDAMAKKVFGTVYVPTFSAKISDRRPPLARNSDPSTSVDAAESMEGHAKEQEAVVLAIYAAYPEGLTAEECGTIAGRNVWRRVSDLSKEAPPRLVDTGRTRANASGRKARVLRSAE